MPMEKGTPPDLKQCFHKNWVSGECARLCQRPIIASESLYDKGIMLRSRPGILKYITGTV